MKSKMTYFKTQFTNRNRIVYIDFLRAIAILYIVAVRHLDDYAGGFYHNNVDDVATYSFLGLFVFISGYLLSLSVGDINGRGDFWLFFKKRFIRIYPLFVLALLLFRFCSFMSTKDFLMHLFLLNIFTGNSVMTLWFVSMMCIYYLIFPFVKFKYSINKTLLIIFIISFFIGFMKIVFGLFDIRLLVYLPLFFFGVICHNSFLIEKYLHNKFVIIISLLFFFSAIFSYFYLNRFHEIYLILLMLNSLPILLLMGEFISSIINKYVFQKIAYASFCMYLFHRVIYFFMTKFYHTANNVEMIIYLTLIAVPVIYCISYFIQKKYDQLVMR